MIFLSRAVIVGSQDQKVQSYSDNTDQKGLKTLPFSFFVGFLHDNTAAWNKKKE
jgi:hypothetical protein